MTTGYGIFRSVSWLIKQHLVKSSLLSDVWGGFIGWKDSKRIGKIWHVEKGLFSSVGGMRRESGRPLCFDSRLYNARTIITVHSNIRISHTICILLLFLYISSWTFIFIKISNWSKLNFFFKLKKKNSFYILWKNRKLSLIFNFNDFFI